MKPLRLLLVLPALFLLQNCAKNDTEPTFTLPEATTVGANTVGFEVDDRVWVNYGSHCYMGGGGCSDNIISAMVLRYGKVSRLNFTAALTTKQRDEYFEFSIDTLRGPGVYESGKPLTNLPAGTVADPENGLSLSAENSKKQYRGYVQGGTRIVLTKVDTVQHIISGTFEGRLEDSWHRGNFITIRYGRFDVTYGQLK